jgi:hypothetical protein
VAVNWSLRSSLLGLALLSAVHPGQPSPYHSGFFEAEVTLVAIHGLADDHVIEELDLENPGASLILRVSRRSASLGFGSPEG